MTCHEAKLMIWRAKLNLMCSSCKSCIERKKDINVVLTTKIPGLAICNVNAYVACDDCVKIKQIMDNEPHHDVLFFNAIPKKKICYWYHEYDTNEDIWHSEINSLNILGYYCEKLFALRNQNQFYDYFVIHNYIDFEYGEDLQPKELLEFHNVVKEFEKYVLKKKYVSVVLQFSLLIWKGI
jgi:hypothetical protein